MTETGFAEPPGEDGYLNLLRYWTRPLTRSIGTASCGAIYGGRLCVISVVEPREFMSDQQSQCSVCGTQFAVQYSYQEQETPAGTVAYCSQRCHEKALFSETEHECSVCGNAFLPVREPPSRHLLRRIQDDLR